MEAPRSGDRLRVGGGDLRTEPAQLDRDIHCRGIAHVVGVGLEGQPEHRDPLVVRLATEGIDHEVDDSLPAPEVDRVDLLEEGDRLAATELLGAGGEGPDVLGQAAAAEPDTGVEEAAPDARVVPDRVGQLGDVGAGRLGDLRHGIDERDLGGQEGVGRDLHQLCRGVVGHDEGRVGGQHRLVDLPEHCGRTLAGLTRSNPVDDAIGGQSVGDREAFAQKLGVPREMGARRDLLNSQGEPLGGPHGNRGLAHHDITRRQVRQQRLDGAIHEGEVGRVLTAALGSAHRHEVSGRADDLRDIGREAQAARILQRRQQVVETGLEEGSAAGREQGDLVGVGVDADHLVAELGHAGRVDSTQVAASDHRQLHVNEPSRPRLTGGDQSLRRVDDVLEQHGSSHGPDAAGNG